MQLSSDQITRTCTEQEIYEPLLSLDNKKILELGCGKAEITRQIASRGTNRRITATEVDRVQHDKNLLIEDLPNVTFLAAGAETIPLAESSCDLVLMFKSLHHVPVEAMDRALSEIHRVLKPGGRVYISEPIFAGSFNQVLRIFHDEQLVRQAAFDAVRQAVADGRFRLIQQLFFNSALLFENFSDFESRIIKVTHSNHQLSAQQLLDVQNRFLQYQTDQGFEFLQPIRVDLLEKPV